MWRFVSPHTWDIRAGDCLLDGMGSLATHLPFTQRLIAPSTNATQCRTGRPLPLCRWVVQPMLALMTPWGCSAKDFEQSIAAFGNPQTFKKSPAYGARGDSGNDFSRVAFSSAQFTNPVTKWDDAFGGSSNVLDKGAFDFFCAAFNQTGFVLRARGIQIGAENSIQFIYLFSLVSGKF